MQERRSLEGQAALPAEVATGFLLLEDPDEDDPDEDDPDEDDPDEDDPEDDPDEESDPPDFAPFDPDASDDALLSDPDVDGVESPEPFPLAELPAPSPA